MSKGVQLSILLFSLTVLLMAAFFSGTIKSKHWEISDIEIDAEFKRVNSEQIRVVVAAYPERSFFKLKAAGIKESLLEIPWVQSVRVTKKWPRTLVIKLIEHKAVAVWNKNQLLNDKGEIFEVDSIDDLSLLPSIEGKDKDSKNIWEKYVRYNEILKTTGYEIGNTVVSDRGGWVTTLTNGIKINFGSRQVDARLLRLADTWVKLFQLKKVNPEYIDLRYTNGYAVKWMVSDEEETDIGLSEDGKLNG